MPTIPFTWPRTDGNSNRWPVLDRTGGDAWHERVPLDDKKYELYEKRIAEHLATRQGIKGVGNRIRLPEGYALFTHRKPQADGKIRDDVYLFGTVHTSKFRSPNEFLPHVDWLLDSTDVTDHSDCSCQYNKGSAAHTKRVSQMTASGGSGSGTKRSAATREAAPKKQKKRASESSQDDGPDGVPLERSVDLRSQRRVRRGELVWVKIDPIQPTVEGQTRGLPTITHWPALCSRVELKTATEVYEPKGPQWATAPSTSNGNGNENTNANGNGHPESSTQPTNTRVVKYYSYHLRALGFFDPKDEIQADAEELLPWLVGSELLGGETGWGKLGDETHAMIEAEVTREAEAEAKLPNAQRGTATLEERWKKAYWTNRLKFSTMPRDWNSVVVRAGLAIKMALSIAQSWTQTDAIAMIDPDQVNEEDRLAIQQQKKSIYQGLWWGGERIWLEDIVRLTKKRGDLPAEQFPLGNSSKDGCVFMKLRVISVEVTETEPKDKEAVSWRCVAYGDIYELVSVTVPGEERPPMAQFAGKSSEDPIVRQHLAPKGYKYRQINDQDTEVTSDVVDIAGRVYVNLADPSTQNYFYDPQSPPSDITGRVPAGPWVKGLMGLLPGTEVYSYSEFWREDLYSIVSNAHKSVEGETKAFYGTELASRGVVLAKSATEPQAESAAMAGTGAAGGQDKMPTAVENWVNSVKGPEAAAIAADASGSGSGSGMNGNGNGNGNGDGDVVMGQPATLAQAGV